MTLLQVNNNDSYGKLQKTKVCKVKKNQLVKEFFPIKKIHVYVIKSGRYVKLT